ncbi:MAG: DUF4346 domain-containing protein [Pseudanabaenaceae cyanobacterium]
MSPLTPEQRQARQSLDDRLSRRPLTLDPGGYVVIFVDESTQELVAKFYTNFIDERGLACDPATGKPIPCDGGTPREPARVCRGRTAKELCVALLEGENPIPITRLDHAAYLGRECQRAEEALRNGTPYVQD